MDLLGDVFTDERKVQYLIDGEPVARILGQTASDGELKVVMQIVSQQWILLLYVFLQALHVIGHEWNLTVA